MSLTAVQLTTLRTEILGDSTVNPVIPPDPIGLGYAQYLDMANLPASAWGGIERLMNDQTKILVGHFTDRDTLINAIANSGLWVTLKQAAANTASPIYAIAATLLDLLLSNTLQSFRLENSAIQTGLSLMVSKSVITTAQQTEIEAIFVPLYQSRAMELFGVPVDWTDIGKAVSQ